MKRLIILLCILSLPHLAITADKYLGQDPPGLQEKIFLPGLISSGLYERDIAVNKEGTEIYYTIMARGLSLIMVTRLIEGRWTEPEVAPFSSNLDYQYAEPALSPDGNKIYFLCTAPPKGEEPKPGWGHQHIWVSDRPKNNQWSKPYEIGPSVNSNDSQFFPSFTSDNTLYYTFSPASDPMRSIIYRSRFIDGSFQKPEPLPSPVNCEGNIYNAVISPDESFLIACVQGRSINKSPETAEYFVYFRSKDDTWSEPVNLSKAIDKEGTSAISVSLSPDGKYIFFASDREKLISRLKGRSLTLSDLNEAFNSHGNGYSDIYWVSSDILKDLAH